MKPYELLFPPKCVSCGALLCKTADDLPLCEHCLAKWEFGKEYVRDSHKGQAIRSYTDRSDDRFGLVMFSSYYDPKCVGAVENRLIFSLKDRGGSRVVDFAARELAYMLEGSLPLIDSESCVIAWVPRRRSSVRAHGFDHMERVARCLSRRLAVPAKRLIHRKLFTAEQKHLGSTARRRNAYSTMVLSKDVRLEGKTVILIDDIVTTGASLEVAARLMMSAGAAQVIAAVLCATDHTHRDEYLTQNGFNIIKESKSKE